MKLINNKDLKSTRAKLEISRPLKEGSEPKLISATLDACTRGKRPQVQGDEA